jgi:uncharacterized protein (DUF4213/DUF364 family)
MIIEETYNLLKLQYSDRFKSTFIEKVIVGVLFTAVRLSNGYCGVAKTDTGKNICFSNYRKKDLGDFSPGKITEQKINDLFDYTESSGIIEIVKLAVLNAVSAEIIAKSKYHIEDKDPIDLIDLSGQKTICIVGAFNSYIKRISTTANKLIVLELNENAFSDEHKKYYAPAHKAAAVFSESDIIIITGSTLANNTIDNLLKNIPVTAQIVVVGPTSSLIPDVLFKYNVDLIGSVKILDAEKMFTIISEGGAGYHLFNDGCAKKICLINDNKKTIK